MSQFLIHYRHDDCEVEPGVAWDDVWDCACNGECPACGMDDIEPVSYEEVDGEPALETNDHGA